MRYTQNVSNREKEPEMYDIDTDEIDLDQIDTDPAPQPAPVPEGRPATVKQIDFIARLAKERDTEHLQDQIAAARSALVERVLSTRTASALISALLDAPRATVQAAPTEQVTEGMYRTSSGTVYKVQTSPSSGYLYAKVLIQTDHHEGRCAGHLRADDPSAFDAPLEYCDEEATCAQWVPGETSWAFEYAPGAVRRLSAEMRMTMDEAREWGALYGTCIRCGRTLTNETSIAAGIGPICAAAW